MVPIDFYYLVFALNAHALPPIMHQCDNDLACMQRGNKDRFYVSPKAVYALQRTQQLQIHRCWPLGKNKMMTFPEHQGCVRLGRAVFPPIA
jgi:hypothetical protein